MSYQIVKQEPINGVLCDFYTDSSGEFYMTRQQIGEALEYENPNDAIYRIHERHKERLDKFSIIDRLSIDRSHKERLDRFSTGDKLSLVEGGREVERERVLYSARGVYVICRWSRQPKADEFYDRVYDILEGLRTGRIKFSVSSVPNPAALIEAHEEFDSRIMEFFQFLQETLEGGEYVLLPRYCDGLPTVPWENILGLHDNLFYYLRTREVDRLYRQVFPDIKPRWIWNSLMTAGLIAGPGADSYRAAKGEKSISVGYKGKHMSMMRLIRYKMPVELPTRGRNNIIMVDRRGMTEEEYLSYTQPEEFWIEDD